MYHINFKKLFAFTLAEVLIALGIIGVVAALTMPSLIAKYQKKALESQFKRAYANIYNAIRLIQAKEGELPMCYYRFGVDNTDPTKFSECVEFYTLLSKQMNIIKTCQGNAYNDGCIPKYQGVDTIKRYEDNTATLNGCSGYTQTRILNKNWAFVFSDGTILFTFDSVSNNLNNYSGVFTIDVNGKKGPNKWGYDLFSFALNEQNSGGAISMIPTCSLREEGGKSPNEMLSNIKD